MIPGKRWVLFAITLIAVVRGLFWVAVIEVPSPIDEIHHLGYIDSLATGRGIPRVGTDFLSRPLLELLRQSPTFGSRHLPLDPHRPDQWGATAHQYEAVQPPLYYGLMVPAYLAGKPWGPLGSLYSVRIASVLLAAAAVPLTWLLAKSLFPTRTEIWHLSALLLSVLQGFNANMASVTNDALVVPLAAAALLLLVRSRDLPGWRWAAGTGLVIGAAMLAKLNAVALIPALALALLILPGFRDRSFWWRIRWGALVVLIAAVLSCAWLAWNRYAYGTFGGGSTNAVRLLEAVQVTYPFTFEGAWNHLVNSQSGFWQFQRFSPRGPGRYGWLFVGTAALIGTILLIMRRGEGTRRQLLWLACCWPLAFLSMLAIVYLAYTGSIVGRHTYPALIPLIVFTVAGFLALLGHRFGTITIAVILAAALWLEQAEYKRYLNAIYLEPLWVAAAAPVWDQPLNFGWASTSEVLVRSSCPIVAVGLGIADQPPAEIEIADGERRAQANLIYQRDGMARYVLPEPYSRSVEMRFPAAVALGTGNREGGRVVLSRDEPSRSAVAQIHCPSSRPVQSTFDFRFTPLHAGWITYGLAIGWAKAWALAGILLALALIAAGIKRDSRP